MKNTIFTFTRHFFERIATQEHILTTAIMRNSTKVNAYIILCINTIGFILNIINEGYLKYKTYSDL